MPKRHIIGDNIPDDGYVVACSGDAKLVLTKDGLKIRVNGTDIPLNDVCELIQVADLWASGHTVK